jgi:tRNA G10  N-methylase Trm11
MPSYAAFIGHQPALSLAELAAALPDFRLTRIIQRQAAVFESSADLTTKDFVLLGGTIVLAKMIEPTVASTDAIPQTLYQAVSAMKGKVTFSLRTVGLSPQTIQQLYRRTKDQLKKFDISSRYVGSEREAAPSVVLHDQGLLDGKHGAELVILQEKDFFWVGRTIAAQDVHAYAKRDIEKPVRDTTVGLLPPKLAQMLLNFGQWLASEKQEAGSGKQTNAKKSSKLKAQSSTLTVFDPFCGTGVIPLECLIRGWHVLASDSSAKAVGGCEKNVEWIRKEEKILKKDVASMIWKQDATKPFKLKELPDVIVTETSLGPNLRQRPTVTDIKKLKSDNEALQIDFLKNVSETLPGVPLVVTWPVWFANKTQVYLEKPLKQLEKLGYEAVLPPDIKPTQDDRVSILYRRPDQFVGREVVMLRPKG